MTEDYCATDRKIEHDDSPACELRSRTEHAGKTATKYVFQNKGSVTPGSLTAWVFPASAAVLLAAIVLATVTQCSRRDHQSIWVSVKYA